MAPRWWAQGCKGRRLSRARAGEPPVTCQSTAFEPIKQPHQYQDGDFGTDSHCLPQQWDHSGPLSPAASSSEDDDEEEDEDNAGETFMEYRPRKLEYGCPHPDPVVETASLAAVEPPDITHKLHLDDLVEACKLSGLQLESIVYACQRHEQLLPDGSRCGFFIGDGAPPRSAVLLTLYICFNGIFKHLT